MSSEDKISLNSSIAPSIALKILFHREKTIPTGMNKQPVVYIENVAVELYTT